ncbi:MAG TPA: outer membrane protein assembly factor BamD [Nitrospirae bacterium]|nr:outer membrane protein assembly factor BamD [Nitrospirota bacterium]
MKKQLCALALAALIPGFSGCHSDKQIIKKDSVLVNRANNNYARGRLTQASEEYRKLINEHPDSSFRKQAIIALADTLYKDKKYFEAVLYYERFIQLYPLDPLTSRAQFYLAMSHYNDTSTLDRDQTSTVKTVEAFEVFLKRYPKHLLVPYAKEKKRDMEQLRSKSMMDIARFYRKINRNQSAITRLNEFIDLYPDSGEAPEALFLIAECYMAEQSFKNAALAYTWILDNYPDSEYAPKAAIEAQKLKLKK